MCVIAVRTVGNTEHSTQNTPNTLELDSQVYMNDIVAQCIEHFPHPTNQPPPTHQPVTYDMVISFSIWCLQSNELRFFNTKIPFSECAKSLHIYENRICTLIKYYQMCCGIFSLSTQGFVCNYFIFIHYTKHAF